MNRRRIRSIINQKIKMKYFKNMDSIIMLNYWILICPGRKYIKKILNQNREQYDEMRDFVDGISK